MSVWFHKFHVSIFQYGSVAAKFQVVYEGTEAVNYVYVAVVDDPPDCVKSRKVAINVIQ